MAKLNGVVAEYCARNYGGRFQSLDYSQTIGVGPVQFLPNNSERVALIVINLGLNPVYLRPGASPTGLAAILLAPQGGSFSTTTFDDLVLPTYAWSVATSAGNSDIFAIEVWRYNAIPEEVK